MLAWAVPGDWLSAALVQWDFYSSGSRTSTFWLSLLEEIKSSCVAVAISYGYWWLLEHCSVKPVHLVLMKKDLMLEWRTKYLICGYNLLELMFIVGLCESPCFVTWRSCLLWVWHHFTFHKGQGKAGVICSGRNQAGSPAVWCLGRVEGELAQIPAWRKSWLLSPRVLRQVPGLGIYVLFGEAERLCGGLCPWSNIRIHGHKLVWTSAPLIKPLVFCWAQIPEPCFVSAVLSSPPSHWKQQGTDSQGVLWAPVVGPFQELSHLPCC